MTLEELGWDEEWAAKFVEARETYGDAVVPARVGADFGVEVRVLGEFGDSRATLTGRLRFGDGVRPAVGDFVIVQGEPSSMFVVDVLERRSWLGRQAAGKKTGMQIIGTNLDRVFVVTSFNEDFNINRIERYLVAIAEGGASATVIVNKADLLEPTEREARLRALTDRLSDTATVIETSTFTEGGLASLEPLLVSAQTSSFVGSSGVGKSSIVNVLIGNEIQPVQEVRETDSRGRHTTTHRELFVLPSGALVIDTPGMREFQLWDDSAGLDAFDDIEALARECKFRDCAHGSEPGCAVQAAIDDGELSLERLESWQKLNREVESQRLRVDEAARRDQGRDAAHAVRGAKAVKKSKQKK